MATIRDVRRRWEQIPTETKSASLALSVVVGLYGVAFGASATSSGFGVLRTCVLSLVMFTGASQFALIGTVAAGSTALSAIVTSILLSTRNALYGMQISPWLDARNGARLLAMQLTIDESTNVGLSQAARGLHAMRAGFWLTGLGVYVLWNLGTLLGAVGASALGNPASIGLDAAVPCSFLALLWPRLGHTRSRILAVLALGWALLGTLVLPAGLAIPSAALLVVLSEWRAR